MKWLIVAFVFLLLVACNRTQIIHYNTPNYQGQQTVQPQRTTVVNEQQGAEPENTTNSVTNKSSASNSKTTTSASQTTTQTTKVNNVNFNPANEYTITSCCDEGRLFAETKKKGNLYSVQNIKDILLNIYYSNCNNFNNTRNAVYLRYLGETDINGYLVHYKNTTVRNILINKQLIDQNFILCS